VRPGAARAAKNREFLRGVEHPREGGEFDLGGPGISRCARAAADRATCI
jgi:hypothetical protein